SASRPRRCTRSSAQGFSVRNESAPASATNSCSRIVQRAPPRRRSRSISVTSSGASCFADNSRSRNAALSPLIPPPRIAIRRAPVLAIRWLRTAAGSGEQTLANQRGDHLDETRMLADGRRTHHRHLRLARHAGRLDVEVVKHFDVVADKADRRYGYRLSL